MQLLKRSHLGRELDREYRRSIDERLSKLERYERAEAVRDEQRRYVLDTFTIGHRKDGTPIYDMAGGMYNGVFRDLMSSIYADETAITLATTMKALWVPGRTLVPANYFNRIGRMAKLTAFGKATTDGTAGNYVFEMGYGSGDAPTPLQAGPTIAGTVSQTNVAWTAWGIMETRTLGATAGAGTARMWGQWNPAVALVASTLSPYLFPAVTEADITSIDFTVGTNALTYQLQRSGAGVWTATTTHVLLESLN
jgi:hypothetical protein